MLPLIILPHIAYAILYHIGIILYYIGSSLYYIGIILYWYYIAYCIGSILNRVCIFRPMPNLGPVFKPY